MFVRYAGLAVFAALLPAPAHAVCFAHDPAQPFGVDLDRSVGPRTFTIADEFASSYLVAAVDVASVRASVDAEGVIASHAYRVLPRQTFKGPSLPEFTLHDENTSARFPMEAGKSYLVFVRAREGQAFVDNCGWSDQLTAATDTLAKVGALSATTRPPPSP